MKLNHAKIIVQEEKYVEACRVIAEAEAEAEKAAAENNAVGVEETETPVEETEGNNE